MGYAQVVMWGLEQIARHPLAADYVLRELEQYQKVREQCTWYDIIRIKRRIRETIARKYT